MTVFLLLSVIALYAFTLFLTLYAHNRGGKAMRLGHKTEQIIYGSIYIAIMTIIALIMLRKW